MKAYEILCEAINHITGDRDETHGPMKKNHQNIADLWNAYLSVRLRNPLGGDLTPKDVALMMVLLKVARTKLGDHNLDDYTDMAGYAGVAGEIAEREKNDDQS